MTAPEPTTAAEILMGLRAADAIRQAQRPVEPEVRPTRYTVTCIPADTAPDAHVWALYVEEKRDGKWTVSDGFWFLDADGEPHARPSADCHHSLDTALSLAREAAPKVIINGRTVVQALALAAEWRAQAAAVSPEDGTR